MVDFGWGTNHLPLNEDDEGPMEKSELTQPLVTGVPAAAARTLCVVIHGRHGAPETMTHELVRHLTAPDVHFVLPRAAGN